MGFLDTTTAVPEKKHELVRYGYDGVGIVEAIGIGQVWQTCYLGMTFEYTPSLLEKPRTALRYSLDPHVRPDI